MSEPVVLFVVEGAERDWRFVNRMTDCFMRGSFKANVISLPAEQNLYMLYGRLAEEDFDVDLVEVLRESVPAAKEALEGVSRQDVAEVYLFFDYDPHQNNVPAGGAFPDSIVEAMLDAFNNETENGKLYISYPMVEALYDYRYAQCQAFSGCFIPLREIGGYKKLSGCNNPNASGHMSIQQWKDAIEVFALRVSCLFDIDSLSYEVYRESVTPRSIHAFERGLVDDRGEVFVLSAFPEFLLGYFPKSFWSSRVKMCKPRFNDCPKGL